MRVDLGALVPGLARLAKLTGRPVPTRYPLGVEERYRTALRALIAPLAPAVRRHVVPRLHLLAETRQDAIGDERDGVARLVDAAVEDFNAASPRVERERASRSAVAEADAASKLALRTQLGVDPFTAEPELERVLAAAVREGVEQIDAIPARFFGAVKATIREGVRRGLRHEEIATLLERDVLSGADGTELAIAQNRVAFIARNQVGSATAKLTEARQKKLGLRRYRWVTSRDERVRGNPMGRYPDARPSHHARDGKAFSWDDPPEQGHPGEAPNCRCIAEPILDDLDDTGEDLTPGPYAYDPLAFERERLTPNRTR
jgi:SPP1 gp7 family putative phage head morphogenesis protein